MRDFVVSGSRTRRRPLLSIAGESDDHLDVDPPAIEREWSHPSSWAGLMGLWTFDGPSAMYRGPQDPDFAYGISITDLDFRGGVIGADVTLDKPEAAGRLVFGHEAETGAHYSAGVGGGAAAYVLDQFVPGRGWITIAAHGASTVDEPAPHVLDLFHSVSERRT